MRIIINTKAGVVNRSSQRTICNGSNKTEIPRHTPRLCTRAGGTGSPGLPVRLQELDGSWHSTRRRQRPAGRTAAEAVGVFLWGGHIQTHPKLMDLYTCMYTKACYSFFVETTTSTSGSCMPTFVPLSLLEEEDSLDFLEAKDTPLPCNLPASSSLPVTS